VFQKHKLVRSAVEAWKRQNEPDQASGAAEEELVFLKHKL
jgi:hypothetical protein